MWSTYRILRLVHVSRVSRFVLAHLDAFARAEPNSGRVNLCLADRRVMSVIISSRPFIAVSGRLLLRSKGARSVACGSHHKRRIVASYSHRIDSAFPRDPQSCSLSPSHHLQQLIPHITLVLSWCHGRWGWTRWRRRPFSLPHLALAFICMTRRIRKWNIGLVVHDSTLGSTVAVFRLFWL